jgi:recombination associated protein RdgC
MWFRNLRIYQLTESLACGPAELEGALTGCSFKPCGGLDASRTGWVGALDAQMGALVHSHGDLHLLCARTQQRLLPAAAVKEAVEERLLDVESRKGRRLGRRERAELKDEVVQTLLPRALTRSHLTRAVLHSPRQLLLVDAAAPARAEELLNLLRESLGSLAVKPLVPRRPAVELMTRWLNGTRPPKPLALGQHCDLRDPLHQANVVRCRRQELASREVRNHLEAGKQAMALGLVWRERLEFVLGEDLALKTLRFTDVAERDAGADGADDEMARRDADFVLMCLEFDRLAADLLEIFGVAE